MNRSVDGFQLAVCCCRLWFTRLQFSSLQLLIAPIADCRTAGLLVSRANCLLPVANCLLLIANCRLLSVKRDVKNNRLSLKENNLYTYNSNHLLMYFQRLC